MNVLETILQHKRSELSLRKASRSEQTLRIEAAALEEVPPGFLLGLEKSLEQRGFAVIAEIKRASPSKGVIRADFNVEAIAKSYRQGQAAALSVLTDERFFGGSDEFLPQAYKASGLPCLRKDFLFDPYQIFEAKVLGASAVLLIVAVLSPKLLRELYDLALSVGLDVLVEVHNAGELQLALALNPKLVGINNRDLASFETSLQVTEQLSNEIPSEVLVVSESGIGSQADVIRLQNAGVKVFLIGETLMRADQPGEMIAELFS